MAHQSMLRRSNVFEERLKIVAESSRFQRSNNEKIIEVIIELNNAQKKLHQKQKELTDAEAEIKVLKSKNREMKIRLIQALIERDEHIATNTAIKSNIERLNNQLDNLNNEMNDLLKGDDVEHICDKFSMAEQMSLLNKIQDNRNKLLKHGFPLNFFA